MKYLLDTCILSELLKPQPQETVIEWFQTVPETQLYLSVLTLGELHKGIAKLPGSKRKQKLELWLETDLKQRFKSRLLNIDLQTALVWGTILAQTEQSGKSMSAIDSLLSATALAYNMILVTRNTRDMEASGVPLLNPWECSE